MGNFTVLPTARYYGVSKTITPSRIDHVTSPSSQSLSSALATRSETLRNVNERLGPKADIE